MSAAAAGSALSRLSFRRTVADAAKLSAISPGQAAEEALTHRCAASSQAVSAHLPCFVGHKARPARSLLWQRGFGPARAPGCGSIAAGKGS